MPAPDRSEGTNPSSQDTFRLVSLGDSAITVEFGDAIDFFTWALTAWPSEKVLAVIWNHGSGIDEADIYARAATLNCGLYRTA